MATGNCLVTNILQNIYFFKYFLCSAEENELMTISIFRWTISLKKILSFPLVITT